MAEAAPCARPHSPSSLVEGWTFRVSRRPIRCVTCTAKRSEGLCRSSKRMKLGVVRGVLVGDRSSIQNMKLTPEVLEACYRAGAFPMDDGYGRIGFYRADPRSILELDSLHVSKSLARVLRKATYEVRVNQNFEAVIRACADRTDTWIGAEIIRAFVRFHEVGRAHSVEAYRDGELAGGLYGVALGGAFMGESMFSRMRDASRSEERRVGKECRSRWSPY